MSALGFISMYLLCSLFVINFCQRLGTTNKVLIIVVILGLMFLPVAGTTLAAFLFSLFGELSVTTLLLLSHGLLAKLTPFRSLKTHDFWAIMALSSLLGLLLYSTSLSPLAIDFYSWGYAYTAVGWSLVAFTSAVGLLALWRGYYGLLLALCLASLAYNLGWYQSSNFWDHLIDAPLFLYSLYFWLNFFFRRNRINPKK